MGSPVPVVIGATDCLGGAGVGGSFACSDLDDCSLADLSDVAPDAPNDGQVLTWSDGENAWGPSTLPAAPSGGGIKDFGEVLVTGGNGATGNGSPSAVTNLSPLTIDADEGDLIEVAVQGIFFGPQTFYGLALSGGATPRAIAILGWYYTSNIGGQGGWSWAPFKFLALADDIDAGTITITLTGNGQGGSGTVLEGSRMQATNLGAAA